LPEKACFDSLQVIFLSNYTTLKSPKVRKGRAVRASTLFEGKRDPKPVSEHSEPERLYSEIGKLKMELDWLKKSQA
jgi:hypothetical protein